MKRGYTLVELMIIVAIVGILISFGISAYARSRDRQQGLASVEQLLTTLHENQTIAAVGHKDCDGQFIGQQVQISSSGTITSHSVCSGGEGASFITNLENIVSVSPAGTLVFQPLSRGITLPTNPYYLDLTSKNGLTYRLSLTSAGIIEYTGIQSNP